MEENLRMGETMDEKAQQLLEETDADARMRTYQGVWNKIIVGLLIAWAAFQLYFTTFGIISAMNLRAFHCMFLLIFTFLIFPMYKKENRVKTKPGIVDILLSVTAIIIFGYLIANYTRIARSGGFLTMTELVIAGIGLLLVLEAARRACGNLAVLGLIFFAYNFFGELIPGQLGHTGFTLRRVLGHMFWGSQGIFGVGIGVSATYIFIFVLFGAFLKYSGFSRFINDFSLTLVGQSPGGPAKVAVIASALMGMINGSAVANVATTGTITIPLMKRTGYKKEFAGAVEAVASTGGQFTPPVMGAVGFVMAEFLGISYTKVMIAAIIPAFLYYLGLLFAVHFEAKRLGLSGLSKENIPDAMVVLKEQGHQVIPLVALIGMMMLGYTPLYAAVISIIVTVIVSWFRKETRMGLDKIIQATAEGAMGAISVGVSCVMIGVIIGTVSLTGLGLSMGYLILQVVGENQIYLAGFMVMIMSIILGMGVPGVAAYVIVVAVAIPVLVEAGVNEMAAHMFCLIYACLSNITPPVAMSSYVASGIADSNQTKTSLIAVKLGLIGFIIPFFFLGNPVLLLGVTDVAWQVSFTAALTASIGTIILSAGLHGYLLRICTWPERVLLVIASIGMIHPGTLTDIIGIAILAVIFVLQFMQKKKNSTAV